MKLNMIDAGLWSAAAMILALAAGGCTGSGGAESIGGGGSGGSADDCSHCEQQQVPGCCSGSWTCANECVFKCDSGAEPPLIWDIAAIEDDSTLNVEVISEKTQDGVLVRAVAFTSWQWLPKSWGGDPAAGSCDSISSDEPVQRTDVRIHAVVAIPSGAAANSTAGLLVGHGLHGQAQPGSSSTYQDIIDRAKSFGVVSIGISAPGNGDSEGCGTQKANGGGDCVLFNTVPDVRGAWFYSYALAGMRAITYLSTLPEIDAERLAVAGSSGGGVLSLMVNGIDRRIKVAVPMSASGAFQMSAESGSWMATVAEICGYELDGEAPKRFFDFVDPINYAPTACGPTFLINGFQDEFFPVNSTKATYEALLESGKEVWWDVQPNWDHGYFAEPHKYCATGGVGYPFNMLGAVARATGGLAYWLHHFLLATPGFETKPADPVLSVVDNADGTATFTVAVDDAMAVQQVTLW